MEWLSKRSSEVYKMTFQLNDFEESYRLIVNHKGKLPRLKNFSTFKVVCRSYTPYGSFYNIKLNMEKNNG